jgi:hypothetical protein
MSSATSRRRLLQAMPLAVAAMVGRVLAAQGLEQFALPGPPCAPETKPTPAVPRDATYRSGSPARVSLIEPGLAGTPLVITGTVSGLRCGRLAGARVEVWQADAAGVYDLGGDRLRGYQLTDANGLFRVETIVPGAAPGRAPHIALRVTVAGKADLSTVLFFPGDPRNAKDPRFDPALVLRVTPAPRGQSATFDILLDL